MDLDKLTLGEKIAGGCSAGLLIVLILFPWHKISFGGFSESCNAFSCTNGFLGILAFLLAAAVLAVIVMTKVTETDLPELPIPLHQATFYAAAGAGGLLILKLLLETDFLGFGAYLGILLGGGLAYGGFLINQDGDTGGSGGGASGAPPESF